MPNVTQDDHDILSLDATLDKALHVQNVVEECAVELSSVNAAMREQLSRTPSAKPLDQSLAQCETIEGKVQVCAHELTEVNDSLTVEIEERNALEQALEQARANEQEALHAALHDSLTKLPNRTLFDDRIAHAIAQASRHRRILAVLFIDLDEFKSINDTHGHDAGDRVLQEVSSRLLAIKRAGDTVSRHGGDEFVYLLLDLKRMDDAVAVARKVVATLAEPLTIDATTTMRIRASVGISLYPSDAEDAAGLLERADAAMYRAKQGTPHVVPAGETAGLETATA